MLTLAPTASAITTFLADPNDAIYLANSVFYSGVARLSSSIPSVGNFGCTGSLLTGGQAILTAAHCVTNSAGALVSGTSVTADFGSGGSVSSTNILVYSGYVRNTNYGDLALILLSNPLAGVTTYDIYRDTNEAGQIGDIVGFGRFGSGATGSTNSGNGVRRHGSNLIDFTASNSGNPATGAAATMLGMDFDNGTATNNAFAVFSAAYSDLGVANNLEVGTAQGDSGGPTFLSNKVAAITSFGACFSAQTGCAIPPDVDSVLNSSFGEVMFNTRVSAFASWIDAQFAVDTPEPASLLLVAAGIAALAGLKRRA